MAVATSLSSIPTIGSDAGGSSRVDGSRLPPDLLDQPPNSRLFVVLGRDVSEEMIWERFGAFGDIQDVRVARDKRTKLAKGFAFVKFARSSQACRAMEAMHRQVLSDDSRPIKVFMAQTRASECHRDLEHVELTRIQVTIPKTYTEEDLRKAFKIYGDIGSCRIVRSKVLRKSKGLAYVRFSKPSQAAMAIEECDKSYRAVLAGSGPRCSESSEHESDVSCTNKKRGSHEVQGSSLVTLGYSAVLSEPAIQSPAQEYYTSSTKQETVSHEMQTSNLITLGYSAVLSEPTTQSSAHEYYASSTKQEMLSHEMQASNLITLGCRTILAEPMTRPSESTEHGYYVSSTKQETNSYEVQGINLHTSAKPPGFSEHEYYVSGTKQETNSHEVHGTSLLATEQLPDPEKSDTRSPESISRRLLVVSQFPFAREQLFNLFDLIPGLESCETYQDRYTTLAHAVVQYSNAASAIYAKYKLNGFEYPFGNRLCVTFLEDENNGIDLIRKMATQLVTSQLSSIVWNNNNLALQHLGSSPYKSSSSPSPHLQTDANLPSSRKKAPSDSSVRERLFIVFTPHALPQDTLDDVLCRFGNFINIYLIPGENVGYAMFADRASASDAIAALHGKTVNGVRLKVMLADLPTEDSNKRQRTY